jgi:DNA-binding response OmpR family regulator
MLANQSILIVEDEPLVAMSLAIEIESLDGGVIGPASSVAQALHILERERVSAAILDANLTDRDVTPVALVLARRRLPFVVHSAIGIPSELASALPRTRFIAKPAAPYMVIAHLLASMAGD